MTNAVIGLWMYRNQGGDGIQEQLKKALTDRGLSVINDFDLRQCHVVNGCVLAESGFNLSDLHALYHMNADEQSPYQLHILEALGKSGVKLINSYASFVLASDKFMANLLMRQAGVTVPPSALISQVTKPAVIKRLIAEWGALVVKPRFSYGGKGILKFDDPQALIDFIQATGSFFVDYYVERFIPFAERDYRVEIINHEYVGSYSRGLRHAFKTNMSAAESSSEGLFLANPQCQTQIELAQKAASATGLLATIVDMVKSTEDNLYYVLEVNPMLGIFVQAANAVMGIRPATSDAYDLASDDFKLKKLVQLLCGEVSL